MWRLCPGVISPPNGSLLTLDSVCPDCIHDSTILFSLRQFPALRDESESEALPKSKADSLLLQFVLSYRAVAGRLQEAHQFWVRCSNVLEIAYHSSLGGVALDFKQAAADAILRILFPPQRLLLTPALLARDAPKSVRRSAGPPLTCQAEQLRPASPAD